MITAFEAGLLRQMRVSIDGGAYLQPSSNRSNKRISLALERLKGRGYVEHTLASFKTFITDAGIEALRVYDQQRAAETQAR